MPSDLLSSQLDVKSIRDIIDITENIIKKTHTEISYRHFEAAAT